ncbi:uncharacterized protein CTRU02_208623 [Colletotrichum truncatum]|uniref:Uncharacterized protein n=1 Tax=Colletotrichum truncatum TaxID=5467 RepID=A0ACC3YWS8_COLTU
MSAIHTLAGIRRPGHHLWQPHKRIIICPMRWNGRDLDNADFPMNVTSATWHLNVYVPAPYDMFQAHYNAFDVAQMARDEKRTRRVWEPTLHMRDDARRRQDVDLRDDVACYGFKAYPDFKYPEDKSDEEKAVLEHTFYAAPIPRSGNSLWLSLAMLVEGHFIKSRRLKSSLAYWFNDVLLGPRGFEYPGSRYRRERFRMYCQLLANSRESVDPGDVNDWGPMDLLRCLNANDHDSGMPMEAGFHEMLHLVADFFGCEVITFIRRRGPPALWRNLTLNDYKLKFSGRRQILLVTDPSLRHFQPVIRVEPDLPKHVDALEVEGGEWIDTTTFDPWDRHVPMPWWMGYHRNVYNTGWAGQWEIQGSRPWLRTAPAHLDRMVPRDITTGMTLPWNNNIQALGPYWSFNMPVPDTEYYEGDTDMDTRGVQLQSAQERLTWHTPNPPVLDDRLALTDWPACYGENDGRFKSKGHFEGSKRVAELYLSKTQLGFSEMDGFLSIQGTEAEDRIPPWHKRRRR